MLLLPPLTLLQNVLCADANGFTQALEEGDTIQIDDDNIIVAADSPAGANSIAVYSHDGRCKWY